MSHSVTVTRTTTTSTTSAILLNTGYFKTYPGLLKLLELLIGAVVVGLTAYYSGYQNYSYLGTSVPEIFLCIVAVACLMGTGCLLVSCILSISTASILPKTIFEVIFHSVAFVLYLAASINFLVALERRQHGSKYDAFLAAAEVVFGVVAVVLLLSASANMLKIVSGRNDWGYNGRVCASILGLINTVLYLLSTALAYRSYKGK